MPTVMIRETPLPTPRSVIWSPIHIRSIVPSRQADNGDHPETEARVSHQRSTQAVDSILDVGEKRVLGWVLEGPS